MPIIKSAIKRMHQAATRKARNQQTKRGVKAAVKAFSAAVNAKNLSKAQSEIDKAVKKNLIPKNTAARRKARLAATAKAAGVKLTKTTPAKPVAKAAAPAKKPAAKKPAAKAPAKAASK